MELDINADTGLGASGCALGNHTCKGTAPAFDANPKSTRTKAKERVTGDSAEAWALRSAKLCPLPLEVMTSSPRRIDAAPNWVITPYHSAALRASGWRAWSVRISNNELSAISSQQNISVMMLDAAGTASRVKMKTMNMLRALRDVIAPL